MFPKKHLSTLGITEKSEQNAIANIAYTDWGDNQRIGFESPTNYWPKMTDAMEETQLDHQNFHHALPLGWESMDYEIFKEQRRILIAKVVQKAFHKIGASSASHSKATSIRDMISRNETDNLEFKSSARWCYNTSEKKPYVEHAILKTVCGFANANGGYLICLLYTSDAADE